MDNLGAKARAYIGSMVWAKIAYTDVALKHKSIRRDLSNTSSI